MAYPSTQPPQKPRAPTYYPNSPTGAMPSVPGAVPPAGGYNNPANAPQNDGMPPRPAQGTSFGAGKAQGGTGPASTTTTITDGIPQTPPSGTGTSSATIPGPRYRPVSAIPVPPPPPTMVPDTAASGNLRGEVYTPGSDPRLTGQQGYTDQAMQRVLGANRGQMQDANESRYRSIFGSGQIDPSGYGVDPDQQFRRMDTDVRAAGVDPNVARGPGVDPMESARTARYGQAQDQALEGLNGPDRTALAMQKLKDFDAASNEQRFNEERALGQNIVKFGRSGMQSNAGDFGEITRKIAGDRGRLANELARSVAEGDINDRFRRVDTTSGLRSMESGIDAGMRGERRMERDYGTALDERNVGRQMDERNFRASLDSQNLDRGRNERDLETALGERNIGRRMGERDTRLNIANGNEDRRYRNTSAALGLASDQTDRGIGDLYDQLNAAGTLEDRIFGQGRSNRDEYRTERGYQEGAAQRTIENRIKERELQQAEEEMRLRRAALAAQAGGL